MTNPPDNIIRLPVNALAPEIRARSGTVKLNFGYDDDRETVELEGSLTITEVCFLKEILSLWIRNELEETPHE